MFKKKSFKRLIVSAIVIFSIVFIINLVWFFGFGITHVRFANSMERDTERFDLYFTQYNEEMGLYASWKFPGYLGSGGFYKIAAIPEHAVYQDRNMIRTTGLIIELYFWPRLLGDYEIGLDFYDMKKNMWIQVYIDSELHVKNTEELDSEVVAEAEVLIAEHYEVIDSLFDYAEESFGIFVRDG